MWSWRDKSLMEQLTTHPPATATKALTQPPCCFPTNSGKKACIFLAKLRPLVAFSCIPTGTGFSSKILPSGLSSPPQSLYPPSLALAFLNSTETGFSKIFYNLFCGWDPRDIPRPVSMTSSLRFTLRFRSLIPKIASFPPTSTTVHELPLPYLSAGPFKIPACPSGFPWARARSLSCLHL